MTVCLIYVCAQQASEAMMNCILCKGKGMCGRPFCPILEKFRAAETAAPHIKDSIFGASPPSVFVGRIGYPEVSAGPLIPPSISPQEAQSYDSPRDWRGKRIEEVIALRSSLVRSNTRLDVHDFRGSVLLERAQELAMSAMPVDAEVWFRKPPAVELKFDDVLMPMGLSGEMTRLRLAENPSVPRKVDSIVGDTDALAKDAVRELYSGDVSLYHIIRLLSIGLLGRQRKLVPTRWSITATDDMVGKQLIDKVRDYPAIGRIEVHSGELFGNHFDVMLLPRAFSCEIMEIWMPRAVWSGESTHIEVDGEGAGGKSAYSVLGGGYYAARLGALEYLQKIGRSAAVFVAREIRPAYWAPLGVWVVRETMRHTMEQQPAYFDTIGEALLDMSSRLHTPFAEWRSRAKLLNEFMFQRTLDAFF